MTRIVNVIYRPHLCTYLGYEDTQYQCCIVCEFMVAVERSTGELIVASVLDERDLREFNAYTFEEEYDKEKMRGDIWYPFDGLVTIEKVNSFINGRIETGSEPLDALHDTFSDIRRSEANCSEEVKKLIDNYFTYNTF